MSGAVAKWKGRGQQNSFSDGSIPSPRLHSARGAANAFLSKVQYFDWLVSVRASRYAVVQLPRLYAVIVRMPPQRMTNMRRQLQKECSSTLRHYMDILSEGCDLLGEIQEGSIPEEQKEKIFSNRRQELLAQQVYSRAQRRLWRFLSDAAPPPRLENTPEPKRSSREQSSRHGPEKDQRIG
jgi:hypothetical protein